MTPRDVALALRQGWWFIVACILIAMVAAAAVSNALTPQYEASSEVFVGASGSADPGQLAQLSLFALDRVESYAELAQSPLVLDAVVDDLELAVSSPKLADQISVSTSTDTVLMTVTVRDQDAETAASIANAVVSRLASAVAEVEPDAADGSPTISLTTTRQAAVSDKPSSPSWSLNLALAAVLGAAAGGVLAVFRYVFWHPRPRQRP